MGSQPKASANDLGCSKVLKLGIMDIPTLACLLPPTSVSTSLIYPASLERYYKKGTQIDLLLWISYNLTSPSSAYLCFCTPDCGFQILEFISTSNYFFACKRWRFEQWVLEKNRQSLHRVNRGFVIVPNKWADSHPLNTLY